MDDWQQTVSRFEALATEKPLTKAAKIRQLLPQIEAAVKSGITLKRITDQLNSEGIEINYHDFRVLLSRLRAEARKSTTAKNETRPSVVTSAAPKTAQKARSFTPASGSSGSWAYSNNPDSDDPKFKPSR